MKRIVNKLGISVLALLLVSVGTAMADPNGGSSYSSATSIGVPDNDFDIFGTYTRGPPGDWWKFAANDNDEVYVDLDAHFANNHTGHLYLYKTESQLEAHVSKFDSDHIGYVLNNPSPRISITGTYNENYKFLAGRNSGLP
jgi:hypothetical protein